MENQEEDQLTDRVRDNDDSSDTNTVVNGDKVQPQGEVREDAMNLEVVQNIDDASSSTEPETTSRSNLIPEREIRSLSSVNHPGYSEETPIQSGSRRSKPTLTVLRQRFQTNYEQAVDLLDRFPQTRTEPLLPDELPQFKNTFNNLKSSTAMVQSVAAEMTDLMANQGASAEAQEINKKVLELQQIVAEIRRQYEDVLSITSSMYTGSHRSRARSRSASAHSNASRHTTASEIDRRKQAELRRELASQEAQKIYIKALAEKK